MEHTQLSWKDVSQFEEIKGYGQTVWRHNGQYYFVTEEGGIALQRVVYELSDELFQLLDSGQKSSSEILTSVSSNSLTASAIFPIIK